MLSYVENEESGGGQSRVVVLDEGMLFEEPSKGHATAAGDKRKAEWMDRTKGHGSTHPLLLLPPMHQLRPVYSNARKRKKTRSLQLAGGGRERGR